uniref:Zinc finger GRF-type domain-containing protein n=1 Tax=Leersia perrieri TaxID=77586 RepID=A0A0D9VXB8_9ORYZ
MVKQSRKPRTAGRAYYVCRDKYDSECPCYFFKWIDGQDKYDPRIRLFPYDEKELKPYNEFRRWVPPPNPAPMTMEEKSEASCIRVKNPPLCHYGYPCKLQCPNIGVPAKFTPFFRCKLSTHDEWPMCDFQEYIYGPKSFWPTDKEVRLFKTGKTHWPCERRPHPRCKCGILATVGVVTSELGYGYYCGNAYGKY